MKENSKTTRILDSKTIIKRFEKYINENKNYNIIISSEEFEFLNEKQILKLSNIVSPLKCKIIFYIKRQDLLLISEYKQLVKQYRTRFSGSVLDFIFSYKFWNRLNYFSLLERWSKYFGVEALDVRLFDVEMLYRNNVVDDFIKSLDLEVTDYYGLGQDTYHNKSPSDLACEVIRIFNNIDKIDQITHNKIVELSQYLSANANKHEDYCLISGRERRSIFAAYAVPNNRVLNKYFKKSNNEYTNLFPSNFKEVNNKSGLVSEIKNQINRELNLQA